MSTFTFYPTPSPTSHTHLVPEETETPAAQTQLPGRNWTIGPSQVGTGALQPF